jgi:hypothetical protein
MPPVPEVDLLQQLEEMFREVKDAHVQAFVETDGADPDWPIWYADYLLARLGDLLHAKFTRSELVYLLVKVEGERTREAPGADWYRYYARFFAQRYL